MKKSLQAKASCGIILTSEGTKAQAIRQAFHPIESDEDESIQPKEQEREHGKESVCY